MNKAVPGAVFTVSLLITGSLYPISGSLYSTSTNKISRSDYALTSSDALVLIPDANLGNYADAEAADNLYLEPNGFDGTATIFVLPEPSNLAASVAPGVQDLVQAVESQYSAGDFSASDPLYIFGYSQGAVEASLAEQPLANFGIPEQALHFVMVGDSASTEGGFLNTFVDSFPDSWQQPVTELLTLLGVAPPALGATTPDNLYPTDVYSLSGDGWANWDNGANLLGMFTDHLAYFGLTPAEIASATLSTDGLTDYFTINSAGVDIVSALWESLLVALNIS
jgi:PE-PPE domain